MITFLICLAVLVTAYFTYGRYLEKVCGIDAANPVPSETMYDGVDYIPMPRWKTFLIQLLNIAGLGPIFGALLGAAYGPVAFLWITLGGVFMGAMHDFVSATISLKNKGVSLPEIIGTYLGNNTKLFMRIFTLLLMVLVGAVFMSQPAELIAANVQLPSLETTAFANVSWELFAVLMLIMVYYILATILPIDKIIGSVYPYMGAALLFMALGVGIVLVVGGISGAHEMMEITPANLKNWHSDPQNNILFPMLFVVVSCGAISGFHSTQSPLMARCLKNEKYARPVFYGAMITEGIVAMIWASAAMAYFGGPEGLNAAATEGIMVDGTLVKVTPAIAVDMICRSWLGKVGAVIAVIGVVVCPITSGDTAFRSLRLTMADFLRMDQKPLLKRLLVCLPIFLLAFVCCKADFSTVWKYVGISNQLVATIILWTSSAYLIKRRKPHWLCSLPATFLTFICVSYFIMAPHVSGGLHLSPVFGYAAGCAAALSALSFCIYKARRS